LIGPYTYTRNEDSFVGYLSSSVSKKPLDTSQLGELVHDQDEPNIFSKYGEIKKNNEILKVTTYTRFWKQTTSSQPRLLSTFDTEKRKMQMAFLQAEVPFPKTLEDFKKSICSFSVDQIVRKVYITEQWNT